MNLNVFHTEFHCGWSYFAHNPIRWLKQIWSDLKMAHSRITKGWCAMDVWNMDDWITAILPQMLEFLAAKGMGHPLEFENEDVWHEWLRTQAARLRQFSEEEREKNDPCINFGFTAENVEKSNEMYRESLNQARLALREIAEHLPQLWD